MCNVGKTGYLCVVVVASAGFVNSVLVIGACSGACDEQSVSYSVDV